MALQKQEKGNVLIIGNSGVGKSTLINSVLGEEVAPTGWGTHGTTQSLEIYTSPDNKVPFRIIDTIGFEPSFFKQLAAISAVKKWSRECAKEGQEDNAINVIWFCVDGTSAKLFLETIQNLSKATSMWESVPVIVVITKSYSIPDREKNIEMVTSAFAKQERYSKNLKKIIPVVAQPFFITEDVCSPPQGITELITATNECMPEGLKAGISDLTKFILKRKRALSQSVVVAGTGMGVAAAAVPLPFADAAMLEPIEATMVQSIAKIFGIGNDEDAKKFIDTMIKAGTVGAAAKGLISYVKQVAKKIPGVNVVNAIVAGTIVAGLGEVAVYAFEQIYLGNRSLDELDWLKNLVENAFSDGVSNKVGEVVESLKASSDVKDAATAVMKTFANIETDLKVADKPNIRR